MIEERNSVIESRTDFHILNWNDFTMDIINRYGKDAETVTIRIYNKTTSEIISIIEIYKPPNGTKLNIQ